MYRLLVALCFTVLLPGALRAQPNPEEPDRGRDQIQELLVPPDLIMRNQSALNLTADQEKAILGEIQAAQGRFPELQWNLQREVDSLVELIRNRGTEESRIVTQLDQVLDAEREIKKARLLMALRIRNVLTADQLKTLERLRDRPAGRFPGRRDNGPGPRGGLER